MSRPESFNPNLGRFKCIAVSLLILGNTVSTPAFGQVFPIEKTSNHTMGSGADVWRVELRQPNRYLTMTSGDRDGTSELQRLSVTLEGSEEQFHAFEESTPFMSLRANDLTNDYVSVGLGSFLHLTRLTIRDRNGYNLWIHAREQTRPSQPQPVLNFRIIVKSRELDCAGRRSCGRGDSGEMVYSVRTTLPAVRSNRCIPENTYQVTAVNGATMVLEPNSAGRDEPEIIQKDRDDGPHMALQMGEICIASTSR